jgi:DNA modification methylase
MPVSAARPYWTTSDGETVKLYLGDVTDVLRRLPAQSVHCCVTSPPYWGLRDYSTGKWTGGNEECDHLGPPQRTKAMINLNMGTGTDRKNSESREPMGQVCTKCGAEHIDDQIGSEPSPDCGTHGQAQCGRCFVCSMVKVFREVRRVLRDDGVLWLNLGDSYSGGGGGNYGSGKNAAYSDGTTYLTNVHNRNPPLPSGNLIGVPWRVALALQADGWILRQDVIWHKPSPMPESVRNRCTKGHEYIFLLVKKMRYFYDAEAIKESLAAPFNRIRTSKNGMGNGELGASERFGSPSENRNKRSVWTVSSQGYAGAHFATFPPKLIEPCILAGTSAHGCCGECGAPWRRVTQERQLKRERPNDYVKRTGEEGTGNSCANTVAGVEVKTVGWEPTCECFGKFERRKISATRRVDAAASDKNNQRIEETVVEYVSDLPLDEHPVSPCVVLDPFIGSGTTCEVAIDYGLHSIGIDLSEKYLRLNAVPRIEGALYRYPDKRHLIPKRVIIKP